MSDFSGYPLRRITAGDLELDCLATGGPRIVGLRYRGSPNLLARAPEEPIPTPYGEYHYIGGHRLWYAPEAMPRSYVPDDTGLTIQELPDGLVLEGALEAPTGIQKSIQVRLHPEYPQVNLTHTLANKGLWEVKLAPWAISMFRLGGVAILPIKGGVPDPNELLPDRRISLWPYTRANDPRLNIEDGFIAVRGMPGQPLFKIGAFDPAGWSAYWLEGVLFRKSFDSQPGANYPDFGCNAEIYTDSHFIELESLGPLTRLAPGESVSYDEYWELFDSPVQEFMTEEMVTACVDGR
jgi:hypothetical protein